MAETISVRFDDRTRRILEDEASRRGVGISTFVRQLAEAELKRVRRAAFHAEAEALAAYIAQHPTAFDDDDPADWFVPPATKQA
jgi:rubrerythrin